MTRPLPGAPVILEDALCRETSPELFFPEAGIDTHHAAVAVCRACPVRRACLDDALARDERYGIWGGTTPPQRRAMMTRTTNEGTAS